MSRFRGYLVAHTLQALSLKPRALLFSIRWGQRHEIDETSATTRQGMVMRAVNHAMGRHLPRAGKQMGVQWHKSLWGGLLLGGLVLTTGCSTGKSGLKPTQAAAGVTKPVAVFNVTVDAETLFESCHPEPHEASLNLDCDGLMITYVETTQDNSATLERQQREAISNNLEELNLVDSAVGLSIENTMLTIRMVSVSEKATASASAGERVAPNPSAYIYSVAYQPAQGSARGAMCTAEADEALEQERCLKFLGYLMLHGLPDLPEESESDGEPLEEEESEPMLLDQAVEVPDDCELRGISPAGGTIQCEAGSFTWFDTENPDEAGAALNFFTRELHKEGRQKSIEKKMACEVMGHPAQCSQYVAQEEGFYKNVVVLTADVDERHVVLICFNFDSPTELHSSCTPQMKLK